MVARLDVEPCYFGADSTRLFGCYHPPRSPNARAASVILCYPMGQEYIRAHRTYRLLAARLAEAGFPVLRFDFAGSGDSPGDCEHGRIGRWLGDLSLAIREIRQRCGPTRICLAGLRLGGTLAMMYGAQRGGVDGIVLWDPIVDGRTYVDELTAWHRGQTRRPETTPGPTEILGFPLTQLMREDLEGIDLLSIRRGPATHALVVDSSEGLGQAPLRDLLQGLGVRVDYRRLAGPKIWIKENKTIVPHQALGCVAAWISGAYP
jgi:pimeloyl-ACP methyl ester carboxylesterase